MSQRISQIKQNCPPATAGGSELKFQPAKTGTPVLPVNSAGDLLSRPPLFSRPGYSRSTLAIINRAAPSPYAPRANKSQPTPAHLRRRGRIFLNGSNDRATYVGRNCEAACEVCGSESSLSPDAIEPRWLQKFLLALARKRVHRKLNRKDVPCMNQPQDYAVKLAKLPDRVAAILAKTVAVKGDAFELNDDQALIDIMDLINDLDSTLIERNAKKKLAPKPRR